jgi:hypothetical protein
MAASLSTVAVEQKEKGSGVTSMLSELELPIEQRTDVTVDELEKLSLPYAAELYDGRVVFKMPNLTHGLIQTKIGHKLEAYLENHPIGVVPSNTNFRLWPDDDRHSRAPDVSFILREHLPKDFERFPAMAPDLAVEILSHDDSFLKVMEKVNEYLSQQARQPDLPQNALHLAERFDMFLLFCCEDGLLPSPTSRTLTRGKPSPRKASINSRFYSQPSTEEE